MTYRVLFPCYIAGQAHIDGLVEIEKKDWYILQLIAAKSLVEEIKADEYEAEKPTVKTKTRAKK
jgi:hypothetical protein